MLYTDKTDLRRYAYGCYQMNWLITNHYDLEDLLNSIDDACEDWPFGPAYKMDADVRLFALEVYEMFGFGGIWSSYDEFMKDEYLDVNLMLKILPVDTYIEYLQDVADLAAEDEEEEDEEEEDDDDDDDEDDEGDDDPSEFPNIFGFDPEEF